MAKKRTDAERRARQCERIGRVLRVLQLVLSRSGCWDAPAIARELEVSERTVYRDLQTLTMAGVPLFFDPQTQRYCVQPGFRLTCLEDLSTAEPCEGEADSATTPEQLADRSVEAAQRLLEDAGELVAVLSQLRDALRKASSG